MQRSTFLVTGLVAILVAQGACTLDVARKPQCESNDDCGYFDDATWYCVAQACVEDEGIHAAADTFWVQGSPSVASPIVVMGDVLANDDDASGHPLALADVSGDASSTITMISDTTVAVTVTGLPAYPTYRVGDGIAPAIGQTIDLLPLPATATVPVPRHAATDVASAFAGAASLAEVTVPPAHGSIHGSGAGEYTPDATFCGDDQATYVVHALNGDQTVVVTFEVALPLVDEDVTVDFSAPSTIDVLANDAPGLELVSVASPFATLTNDNRLLVKPPVDAATTYDIPYVARDGSGHVGGATLHLAVEFPTEVIVGGGTAGDAFDPVLSADGRYLAFASTDATLVGSDTNGASDIFVRDLELGTTERVSVGRNGAQANDASTSPTLSADGRYVAFVSKATNLDARDTSAVEDIYIHDRQTGQTSLASVSVTNTSSNLASSTPHLSADGNLVVFASAASNLVAADTNGVQDIFVRDLGAGTTRRVSLDSAGNEVSFASGANPRLSGNGRYVAFVEMGALVPGASYGTYVVDLQASSVTSIDGAYEVPLDIDATGRYLLDGNFSASLLDRTIATVTTINPHASGSFCLSPDGAHALVPAVPEGAIVAWSAATGAKNAVVDRQGNPVAATPLRRPAMTADGRWIVFATSEWPGSPGQYVLVRVWNPTFVPTS